MPPRRSRRTGPPGRAIIVLVACLAIGCDAATPASTGPIVPGVSTAPREVNLIARDYSFQPETLDLVPGETVLLHLINGGLEVHEAVLGDAAVQGAWETAEAAVAGAPPGPTLVVHVPAEVTGVRLLVRSGERVDLVWTVPPGAATAASPWIVACHIPGHLARGMQIPIRWVPPPAP